MTRHRAFFALLFLAHVADAWRVRKLSDPLLGSSSEKRRNLVAETDQAPCKLLAKHGRDRAKRARHAAKVALLLLVFNSAAAFRPCGLLALSTLSKAVKPRLQAAAFGRSRNSPLAPRMGMPVGQRPSKYYEEFFEQLPDMVGKTVVVTGASKGLGYVTALTLVKKGASVISLNRKSTVAEEAQVEFSRVASGSPPQFVECDLLDFASVREAAQKLREIVVDGIDVLVLNAGIMLQPDEASKDGYDITISTNVLSHFLLTKELLPELEKAASLRGEARVVTMSSGSGFGPPAFDPTLYEKKGSNLGSQLQALLGGQTDSYGRYHQSKLANFLITSALHEKLRARKSRVKALACTPGVCATDMFVHVASLNSPGQPVDLTVVPSVEDGALGQLKCICDPSVNSGELYGPPMGGGFPKKVDLGPPLILLDGESKAKLWEACERAVGSFDL